MRPSRIALLPLAWAMLPAPRCATAPPTEPPRLRVKHPDLAQKVVWAHLDALAFLRKNPDRATEILASYAKRVDKKLMRNAYDKMGLTHSKIPESWINQLSKWAVKNKFQKRSMTGADVTDYSFQKGHPAADK